MNKTELKKLLAAGEWNDVEFKEARTSVPRSAYETVAAFANTHGGHLVLGVAQRDSSFEITVIKFFRDGIQFWNPGDVFGDDSRLWEPGEKEVRNPSIAMAMRRIAMCEQAGNGLWMMRETWRKLGHPSPTYENDRTRKVFEFFIPGLDKEVDMALDLMKAMFGAKPPTQSATQSSDQVEAQVEAQEAQVELAKWQQSILAACATGEQTRKQLLEAAGYKTRTGNFKKGLQRLVEQQLIEYTIPDRPNSRLQKYRLTEKVRQTLTSEPKPKTGEVETVIIPKASRRHGNDRFCTIATHARAY